MANLKSKIGNRKSAMYLSFRKLEAFARALLPVFLSFLDSRIARNQAGVFESRAQVGIKLEQRACNAVTNGACLSGRAAAGDRPASVRASPSVPTTWSRHRLSPAGQHGHTRSSVLI